MNLNLILIILLLVGLLFCKTSKNPKRWYIVWCNIFIILAVSFKSAYYGTENGGGADTLSYVEMYKSVIDMSWNEIWNQFIGRYFNGTSEEDIGYLMLEWVFTRLTVSYHIFSTFADLLFFIPFAIVINRYCNKTIEVFFAYLLFLALFYYFAMNGGRQFFAMGFGIMSFLYYSDGNRKNAIICLLLGMTIHLSLLLILIPFAISFLPVRRIKILHVVALMLIPIVLFSTNSIISAMGNFVGNEQYANYGAGAVQGGTFTYIFLSELLSVICLVLHNNSYEQDRKYIYVYSMVPVFTFFAPLIYSNGTMIRITAYSQIYLTVLLPYLLNKRYAADSSKYLMIASALLIAFMLKGGYHPYHFFWDVDPVYLW